MLFETERGRDILRTYIGWGSYAVIERLAPRLVGTDWGRGVLAEHINHLNPPDRFIIDYGPAALPAGRDRDETVSSALFRAIWKSPGSAGDLLKKDEHRRVLRERLHRDPLGDPGVFLACAPLLFPPSSWLDENMLHSADREIELLRNDKMEKKDSGTVRLLRVRLSLEGLSYSGDPSARTRTVLEFSDDLAGADWGRVLLKKELLGSGATSGWATAFLKHGPDLAGTDEKVRDKLFAAARLMADQDPALVASRAPLLREYPAYFVMVLPEAARTAVDRGDLGAAMRFLPDIRTQSPFYQETFRFQIADLIRRSLSGDPSLAPLDLVFDASDFLLKDPGTAAGKAGAEALRQAVAKGASGPYAPGLLMRALFGRDNDVFWSVIDRDALLEKSLASVSGDLQYIYDALDRIRGLREGEAWTPRQRAAGIRLLEALQQKTYAGAFFHYALPLVLSVGETAPVQSAVEHFSFELRAAEEAWWDIPYFVDAVRQVIHRDPGVFIPLDSKLRGRFGADPVLDMLVRIKRLPLDPLNQENIAMLMDPLVSGRMTLEQARKVAADRALYRRWLEKLRAQPGVLGKAGIERTINDINRQALGEPNSVVYAFSGHWFLGTAGMLLEWAGGRSLSARIAADASAFSHTVGLLPAVLIALGALAAVLYAFSFVHALGISWRYHRREGQAPPKTLWAMTHETFAGFTPYFALPLTLMLAPGLAPGAGISVLLLHGRRDFHSRMGREMRDAVLSATRSGKSDRAVDDGRGERLTRDILDAGVIPFERRSLLNALGGAQPADLAREAVAGFSRMGAREQESVGRALWRYFGEGKVSKAEAFSGLRTLLNGGAVRLAGIEAVYFDARAQERPEEMLQAVVAALALHPGRVRFVLEADRALPAGFEELYRDRANVEVKVDPGAFDPAARKVRSAAVEEAVKGFADVTVYLPDGFALDGALVRGTVRSLGSLAEFFRRMEEVAEVVERQA